MTKKCLVWITALFMIYTSQAQDGFQSLKLMDMSGFQDQSGNWQIVGSVEMNPNVDVHHNEEPVETKKKKKKNTNEPPKAVTTKPGSGVLVNLPTEDKKSNLVTSWEHGDIELDLEVMLPKGSNSGLYLQGRYEVQLLDSWGVKNPKFSDIGGIYRNWESDPARSYMGKAPLANAAKAPGLWQRLVISFRAPKFDANGNKIANARIVKATLNGVTIHENLELPLPTGGPVKNNEVAMGPIMIQGDHGAVAFRNFKYKLMHDLDAELTDISYEVYHGEYDSYILANAATDVTLSGKQDQLNYDIAEVDNGFVIKYKGTLKTPEEANYTFRGSYGGQAMIKVDGDEVGRGWRNFSGSKKLIAGRHQVEIVYFKTRSWVDPYFGLFLSSDNGHEKALHAMSSHPINVSVVAPIFIQPEGDQPRLLRAFLDFEGDRDQRITHSIGVGLPSGINYVYDLGAGNLACVWKGDFVNATPMWHDRGDGSFRPLGMIQYLYKGSSVSGSVKSKGYVLDSESGLPTFIYEVNGQEVKDRIYPDASDSKVIREVALTDLSGSFEVTEASAIKKMDNGMYLIGDNDYYIEILSGQTPEIREEDGKTLLMLPIDSNPIKYSIIW
ncbi:MAG: hypothetical protein CMB80_14365 [Flammeovirgaceae bacterium]|nr:hypothetical protein [Flammeovirgaceae bacterium]MBR09385.1 hypothetical protein [Rickettsiales bacterium]MBR11480.1 hypothetical protein [Rickettsiales bacterium]HCX21427.1 hypothetical protein [Cytophagales bacterium]|tara:strand:- start:2185 stop:4017 length:1833 start_codon:yes stop_codon:yes gene_type:complete